MKSTTSVGDPVCGMEIETATAAELTEHKGQTYYFCGASHHRLAAERFRILMRTFPSLRRRHDRATGSIQVSPPFFVTAPQARVDAVQD